MLENEQAQTKWIIVCSEENTWMLREAGGGLKAEVGNGVTTRLSLWPHSFLFFSVSFYQSLVFPSRLSGGGGGLGGTPIYSRIWMCVRNFQTVTLCRPKFRQKFGPFADQWRTIFENIYRKTPENEFLAIYLCIIENNFVKSVI